MPIPLVNLDTRRWDDLVEEGRALVPRYASTWTDHNVHDPGITLIELLAWQVEAGIYRLNRVPESHLYSFVALAGITPRPPAGARGQLAIRPSGAAAIDLPAGLQFNASIEGGKTLTFSATQALHALPLDLQAVLVQESAAAAPVDRTRLLREAGGVAVIGDNHEVGGALWLGFNASLPPGDTLRLHLSIPGASAGGEERQRIEAEAAAQGEACARPAMPKCPDGSVSDEESAESTGPQSLEHHSARTVWQFYGASGWTDLDAAAGEVVDHTRALTLDGVVELTLSTPMAKLDAGTGAELFYLRVRLDAGDYDAPPVLDAIIVNALSVEQADPVLSAFHIARGATVTGTPPSGAERVSLLFAVDEAEVITALAFGEQPGAIETEVYYFEAPSATRAGWLIARLGSIGRSSGRPLQQLRLPQAPVQNGALDLWSLEAGAARAWKVRPSFAASKSIDAHLLLNDMRGEVTLPDGDRGRIPPAGSALLAAHDATSGARGNLRGGAISALAPSLVNWLLLDRPDFVAKATLTPIDQLLATDLGSVWLTRSEARYNAAAARMSIAQPWPLEGGTDRETLRQAAARASEILQTITRAVTAEDYEALAKQTPGTRIARVRALPGVHPRLPGLQAPGHVTVIVVPDQKRDQPHPSAGLLASVRHYLERRRVIGTRIDVVGPRYVKIEVTAQVRALASADRTRVRDDVLSALREFFHPLRGGPSVFERSTGRAEAGMPSAEPGWPFGRDVYRSEVMQLIDGVPGVDHVQSLDIRADAGEGTCANLCIGPTSLTVSGSHEIEVV